MISFGRWDAESSPERINKSSCSAIKGSALSKAFLSESNNLTVLYRRVASQTLTRAVSSKTKTYTKNISKMEKEVARDFHIRIKNAREGKGWSAREMGKRLNLRLNDIQKTEAGVRPADNILEKIAKALDISLFEDSISEPERTIKTPSSRSMTIGDALDEILAKE